MSNSLSDAELRAKALSRWEGEGGALAVGGNDSLDEVSMRILARIGAALLESWDALPAELADSVALRVRTLGAPGDRALARENLHRFLHRHPEP